MTRQNEHQDTYQTNTRHQRQRDVCYYVNRCHIKRLYRFVYSRLVINTRHLSVQIHRLLIDNIIAVLLEVKSLKLQIKISTRSSSSICSTNSFDHIVTILKTNSQFIELLNYKASQLHLSVKHMVLVFIYYELEQLHRIAPL